MTTPAAKVCGREWRTSCFTVVAEEVRITRQSSWKQWSGATTWVIGITAGYVRPLAECLRQRSAADSTRIRQSNPRPPQWNKYPLRYAAWIFIPLHCCSKFLSEMCKAILTISVLQIQISDIAIRISRLGDFSPLSYPERYFLSFCNGYLRIYIFFLQKFQSFV